MMRAVVLGAGPAGLAAAEALVQGGAAVTVVEAGPSVGGMARSHTVGGHKADLGPHRLHTAVDPQVLALMQRFTPLESRPRRGLLHLQGRRVAYPLSPWPTLRGLGVGRALTYGVSALKARFLASAPKDYTGEARRRVGEALARALYEPAARKVWGRAPEMLDVTQARARVGVMSPWRLLWRLFGGGEPGRYHYVVRGTNGDLYQAWAADLAARGAAFVFDAPVTRVEHDGTQVRGVCLESGTLACEQLVSTLPLPRLLQALEVSPELWRPLAMRTLVLLYVVVRRPRCFDVDVHYFPDAHVPFARLTEQTAFGRDAQSPAHETVLSLDFYDEPDGPLSRESPEQLLARAWPTLSGLGLHRGEIIRLDKVVVPEAYPVLDGGILDARARALDACAAIGGLFSTGRGGLFMQFNQHDAIASGLAAGRTALAGGVWRLALEPFLAATVVD